MIPPTNSMTVTDTLPGREIDFKIGDPFWVMESLADLYSNSELATVRELSTNARDAQDEAGYVDKPIEVSLPNLMSPFFIVKDCGVGMDETDLEDVYTQFGVSTKRANAKANGMLGFGSKAPIAYTGTFSVTSVKNGIKTFAQVIKKTDRITLKVVMTSKTDEPNGTEVKVPVHNHEKFSTIARDFFRFWVPGSVLLDGEEPVQAVGEKIADGLYYSTTPGTSYVVMANVGYRIANPAALFKSSKMASLSFVAYVPPGSVEFSKSREDLKYTDLTINTLQSVITDFEKKMITESKAQIAKAENHAKAWGVWKEWCDRLGSTLFADVEYKGDKFPENIEINGTVYTIQQPGEYYNRYNTHSIDKWTVATFKRALVVTNYTPAEVTSYNKGKAKQYANHIGINPKYIIFTPGAWKSKWVEPHSITWEDLKAALPKKQRIPGPPQPKRPKGVFDYITRGGWTMEKPLPTTGTIYYTTVAETKSPRMSFFGQILKLLDDDGSIVVLAKNRIAKFTRDNPQAIDFVPYAKSQVVLIGNDLLSDDAKRCLSVGSSTRRILEHLDLSKIDDPEFAATKKLVANREELLTEYRRHVALAQALGMGFEFKHHNVSSDDETLIKKYPLFYNLPYHGWNDDVYFYINAKFASIKKGK